MDLSHSAANLTEALNIIMNPLSEAADRKAAYELCEEFKASSPLCVPCGLFLSSKDNNDIVRHFGLQLVEHSIKLKWNLLQLDEKNFIRKSMLDIMTSGTKSILSEEAHIKDVLSRIIVEIIKREWPQQWPELLKELNEIASAGETQKELVLLIFLRLAEDVTAFECLPNRRRKDIFQALSSHLPDLFSFFLKTLNSHYGLYLQMKSSTVAEQKQLSLVHCQVTNVAVRTLAAFVDWVPWHVITCDNNLLLQLFCTLLGDPGLRLSAVECLLLIVNRKGKKEERTPILVLFSDDAMSIIFSAANSAVGNLLEEEKHYLFLKRICELLVSLGIQLADIWNNPEESKEPSTFKVYLDSMLTFLRHPSIVLNFLTLNLWLCFLQHSIISLNSFVQSVIPDVAAAVGEKLVKVGLPSLNVSPSCDFSRLDFDYDEDYFVFYNKLRSEAIPVLKCTAKLQPQNTFKIGADSLLAFLEGVTRDPQKSCNAFLPEHLDAKATYLDSVCLRLNMDDNLKLCPQGIDLLKYLLVFEIKDPLVLSPFLSCMSALFVFLTEAPDLMPSMLNKLVSNAVFPFPVESSRNEEKAVKNLRKHASACIVKISKDHSKLILPVFNEMYQLAKDLSKSPDNPFATEVCYMTEALILISNEFHDFEKQSAFLGEVMASTKEAWMNLKGHMSSTESFISFIGLCESPQSPDSINVKAKNRSQIIRCLAMIGATLRRSKWPSDRNVAEQNGFLVKGTDHAYLRNPASSHVFPLFDGVFSFIRCINSIYDPSVRATVHAEYSSALELAESEKYLLLGHSSETQKDTKEVSPMISRMKNFVYFQYEICFQFLGNAAFFLGTEFYALPGLASNVKDFVFAYLEDLPDFKIKTILHYFLVPLFHYCPPSFYEIIAEILEKLSPFMLQKLSVQWKKFKEQYGTCVGYEDKFEETKEIIEDQLTRLLTREYIDLLSNAIMGSSKWIDVSTETMDEEQKPTNTSEKLSGLGLYLLKRENLHPVLVCTFFNALYWLDTNTSRISANTCMVIFKQLKQDNAISSESEGNFLMECICMGLAELGEHDTNQSVLLSLGVLVYDSLRPIFPNMRKRLMEISGCSPSNVQKLDSMIFQRTEKGPDKKKKDAFRSLVSEIIGKNVGQHFKNKVWIRNLPPLFLLPKPKNCNLDESEKTDLGLCSLFSDADQC